MSSTDKCERDGRVAVNQNNIEEGMVIHASLDYDHCSTWLVVKRVETPEAILSKAGWSIMEIDGPSFTVPGTKVKGKGEFSGRTSTLRRSALISWHSRAKDEGA